MTLAAKNKDKLDFNKESFFAIMGELPPIFLEHYKEIALDQGRMPLQPAWQRYIELEQSDILHILTVRHKGRLVGYHFNFVYPHMHYASTLCSFSDMFFILPQYRQGFNGIKFFIENEKMLKVIGVKKMFVMTKVHKEVQPVMKRLKYKFIERIFSKWIE